MIFEKCSEVAVSLCWENGVSSEELTHPWEIGIHAVCHACASSKATATEISKTSSGKKSEVRYPTTQWRATARDL